MRRSAPGSAASRGNNKMIYSEVRTTNDGFTLVELLIGMVIIAVVSVMALSFLVYCEKLLLSPELRLIAANKAREKMEGLYWLDYGASGGSDSGTLDGTYKWTRNWTVSQKTDYAVITVTVDCNR